MRYMLMMNAPRGTGDWAVDKWSPEDLKAHIAGDHERAVLHYRAAAERTMSIPERNYLMTKAAKLAAEH